MSDTAPSPAIPGAARAHLLASCTYAVARSYRPNLALLPWGATEAHNLHLPHGTDNYEAAAVAQEAARLARLQNARPIVLPTIPFGNNEQQLDQVATISISTTTALALLRDVVRSLQAQGFDRMLLVNTHGGNEFKPLIRDVMAQTGMFIVLVNIYQMCPEVHRRVFELPGDHADEMETSLMLHLHPELVEMENAGPGKRVPFALTSLTKPGVWTPRPWSAVHPDTGSGDPSRASAAKGKAFFEAICDELARVIVEVAAAQRGQIPLSDSPAVFSEPFDVRPSRVEMGDLKR